MVYSHYFHDDILISILKRLPSKTLIKFLSVSKSCYTLIKSPNFISSHFHHNQNRHDLFMVEPFLRYSICHHGQTYEHRTRLLAPCTPTKCAFTVVAGSCNGVVCLYRQNCGYKLYGYGALSLCLWNPSIHKQLFPIPPQILGKLHPVLGFGFDYFTNDYKVVAIYPPGYAQIFSLLAGSWKRVELSELPHRPSNIAHQAVFVNGVIYWIMSCDELCYCNPLLLTFNLREEVFRELSPPPDLANVTVSRLTLAVIDNSLCMLDSSLSSINCVLWQLKEGSWTVLFRFNRVFGPAVCMSRSAELYCKWGDRGVLIQSSGSSIAFDEEPLSSNVNGKSVAVGGKMFRCTESLALLDKFNEPAWMKSIHKLDERD